MDRAGIHKQLTAVFHDVFDDESIVLSDKTTAKDIPDWDSLTHVNLIVAVEKAFKVRFSTKDVQGLANVGEFIDLLARKLG
ncbi:MAG: acyl carrier protein [Polyangiaceae bacterium]